MKISTKYTVFQESNLTFSFNHQWIIYQFDDHRFYKQLAGRNVKGVDFIGIFQQKTLVLIEVKNYIDRYLQDDKNPSEDFLTNQEFYLKKIVKKYVDSLRVIKAVHQAYRRKWWYQLAEKTLFRWIKMERLPNWEFVFWTRAWQLMEAKELRLILWLEIEESDRIVFEIKDEKLPVFLEVMNIKKHDFFKSLHVESN